jgi:serine/threonine-protein kinase RsbW
MLDDNTIELSLPNVVGFERIAMGCSASYAKTVGFRPERIEDLKTAVAEACINAMQHGNRNNPDSRVVVRMQYSGGEFVVTVADKGDGIDQIPDDPDIEKLIASNEDPTGFGLFLIKNLVDQVEFIKLTDQQHIVKMVVRQSA